MHLRTVVRDCLYVNWALPEARLPELPEALRYELHSIGSRRFGFVSAILFRQTSLRLRDLPWPRVAHPQLNVRFYVVDGEGVPSVLFAAMLVPGWVVPLAQAAGQAGLRQGRFDYPRPSRDPEAESWVWRARAADGRLRLRACPGTPSVGFGPDLGSWQRTCDYFRRRDRGYQLVSGHLVRTETCHGVTTLWPAQVEAREDTLLRRLVPTSGEQPWPEVHSSWLCPEMPLDFELCGADRGALPRRVPAPG